MLDSAIGFLRCPQCERDGSLTRVGGSLRCGTGHSFDIARSGYVNLLPAGRSQGDTGSMVAARHDFLTAGHFAGLAATLAQAAAADVREGDVGEGCVGEGCVGEGCVGEGCVADVGAGTGYYLAAVLDRLPSRVGLALDVSKNALRLAARAHPRAAAIGCDAWRRLPVADQVADVVLNIFAPRNGAEFARIIRPGGRLLVGRPAADHLAELIGPLAMLTVDETKEARLAAKLRPNFELDTAAEYRAVVPLDHRAVGMLVTMGPSSWHAEPGELTERIIGLADPVPVTIAVRIASYRLRLG